MTSSQTMISSSELAASLTPFEVKPGLSFSIQTLKDILPDAETVLFFGKVYELDYEQLSNLMGLVLESDLAKELFGGSAKHSHDLQGYLCEDIYTYGPVPPSTKMDDIRFSKGVIPKGEILPEVWKSLEIEVASSIAEVAAKIHNVVGLMPGKQGAMMFQSMMKMNARRPTIGDHKALIHHPPQKENLLIIDDSSSVSRQTVAAIMDDCVALAYLANMHLCLVSNSARHWDPGTFDTNSVMAEVENGGTHYERLHDVLSRDWGVVVGVADYDSFIDSKPMLRKDVRGHIDLYLDVSLVNRPTYLGECVGQFASEVRPMLVANTPHVLGSNASYW